LKAGPCYEQKNEARRTARGTLSLYNGKESLTRRTANQISSWELLFHQFGHPNKIGPKPSYSSGDQNTARKGRIQRLKEISQQHDLRCRPPTGDNNYTNHYKTNPARLIITRQIQRQENPRPSRWRAQKIDPKPGSASEIRAGTNSAKAENSIKQGSLTRRT
jgi:hypothetical protein